MPKKEALRDMVVKKSIREIPIPENRKGKLPEEFRQIPPPPLPQEPSGIEEETQKEYREKKKSKRNWFSKRSFLLGGGILVTGIALFLLLSGSFSKATVTVSVKHGEVSVANIFTARKSASLAEVPYSVLSVEGEDSVVAPATEERQVSKKASGKITIYNAYSSATQRLIKNTRFETADGLIFRISDSVVVPGQSTKDGKVVPGSIETTVVADEAGEKYNINITDFTIPGFKGDPRFSKFYARSVEPMSGGFVGKMKVVADDVLQKNQNDLVEKLTETLKARLKSEVPTGSFFFDDAIGVTKTLGPTSDDPNGVKIPVKVTLRAVIFDRTKLSGVIASSLLRGYSGEQVSGMDLEKLEFSVPSNQKDTFIDNDSFSFTLKGTTTLVYLFDSTQLKDDLAGKTKNAMAVVLGAYPAIEEARVVLRPFWKNSFPTDPKKIGVEIAPLSSN